MGGANEKLVTDLCRFWSESMTETSRMEPWKSPF